MRNTAFQKNKLFPKINSSKKVNAAQKYLFRKKVLLKMSYSKQFKPKRSVFQKLPALKNYLLSRAGCSVEVLLWKSSYFEKITASKRRLGWKMKLLKKSSSSEEIAAPKK